MSDAPVEVKKQAPAPSGPVPDPWTALRSEFDRVFDRFMGGGLPPLRRMMEAMPGMRGMAHSPAVDVTEEKDCFRLKAELPGLSEEDVDLSLDGRMLVLRGEKKQEHAEGDANWHLTERSYGRFERAFTLPDSVDTGQISASFDKGVLTVTLPKRAEAQQATRKIEVKPAG